MFTCLTSAQHHMKNPVVSLNLLTFSCLWLHCLFALIPKHLRTFSCIRWKCCKLNLYVTSNLQITKRMAFRQNSWQWNDTLFIFICVARISLKCNVPSGFFIREKTKITHWKKRRIFFKAFFKASFIDVWILLTKTLEGICKHLSNYNFPKCFEQKSDNNSNKHALDWSVNQ